MTKQRKDFCDIWRGMAALLIVYGHVIANSYVGNDIGVFKIITFTHMPIFFVRGYLSASSINFGHWKLLID